MPAFWDLILFLNGNVVGLHEELSGNLPEKEGCSREWPRGRQVRPYNGVQGFLAWQALGQNIFNDGRGNAIFV